MSIFLVEKQNNLILRFWGKQVSQYLLVHIVAIKQYILVMTHQNCFLLNDIFWPLYALCREGQPNLKNDGDDFGLTVFHWDINCVQQIL